MSSASNSPTDIESSLLPLNETVEGTLRNAVKTVREHFEMDVAFISEFTNNNRVFKYVDANDDDTPVLENSGDPLDETYCHLIANNKLDNVIPDTSNNPTTKSMFVTERLNIGSYIGVPIVFSDGNIYGTFCCLNHEKDQSLRSRDALTMKLFADFVSRQIEPEVVKAKLERERKTIISSIIENNQFNIVFQPIYSLKTNMIVGVESLSRFTAEPKRTPDIWFNEAEFVGLGTELEIAAIKKSLAELSNFPDDTYVTLNISPRNITNHAIHDALENVKLSRIVLEVTEHVPISDYDEFRAALAPLRKQGLKLAIDDAGAGYASFRHILQLDPEIIKLDISITQNVHLNQSRLALAAALIAFAKETNKIVVAEGVEINEELDKFRQLGISLIQGYLIAKPMPPIEAIKVIDNYRDNACKGFANATCTSEIHLPHKQPGAVNQA